MSTTAVKTQDTPQELSAMDRDKRDTLKSYRELFANATGGGQNGAQLASTTRKLNDLAARMVTKLGLVGVLEEDADKVKSGDADFVFYVKPESQPKYLLTEQELEQAITVARDKIANPGAIPAPVIASIERQLDKDVKEAEKRGVSIPDAS